MLKLAVVGGGIMGANHARVAATHRDLQVVAVVDPDSSRADALARSTGATTYGSVGDLIGRGSSPRADAAIVAVPTSAHFVVALELIEGGIHVLVEKPLASSIDEARRLIDAAAKHDVTLMVGHIERFNAAVYEIARDRRTPIHVEAQRLGPFSPRVADSVVLDLMIHDLDIVRMLAGTEVAEIAAVARSVRTDTADMAVALLTFENGMTATVTASRLGQNKVRQLAITREDSYIVADLIRQDVLVHRVEHNEFLSDSGTRYKQSGVIEVPFLENRGEPLASELTEFARAVTTSSEPAVTGADGVAAMEMVAAVLAAARR